MPRKLLDEYKDLHVGIFFSELFILEKYSKRKLSTLYRGWGKYTFTGVHMENNAIIHI